MRVARCWVENNLLIFSFFIVLCNDLISTLIYFSSMNYIDRDLWDDQI